MSVARVRQDTGTRDYTGFRQRLQTAPAKRQVAEAASTNLSKRDQFAQSVQTAAADQGGFELG